VQTSTQDAEEKQQTKSVEVQREKMAETKENKMEEMKIRKQFTFLCHLYIYSTIFYD
jgi:hypothetical protein